MALDNTSTCALDAFDLWGLPPVQKTIEETTVTEHRPVAPLDVNQVIEFKIDTNTDEYILFKESYVYFKIRVDLKRLDRQNVEATDWQGLSTANNLLHSLISQIDIEIGNNHITPAPQTYAYKAYFETLLGFDDSAKKSHLTSALWYADDPNNMNTAHNIRGQFLRPANLTGTEGKYVELMGRLHFDLSFQPRAFLGGSEMKMKIIPHKPSFYLMLMSDNVTPVVKFESAIMYIRRCRVNPLVVSAHAKILSSSPAKYPLTRAEVQRNIIPKGSIDQILENVVTGQLPRRVFVAFVANDAFNGNFKKNPFDFKVYGLNYLCCYINGYGVPAIPYQPRGDNTLREYYGLMDALNQNETSTYCQLDRKDFNNGFAIFGFNLAADLSDGCGTNGHINPIKRGAMRIMATFNPPLEEAITVLTYCEFDSVLQINADRNPIVDV